LAENNTGVGMSVVEVDMEVVVVVAPLDGTVEMCILLVAKVVCGVVVVDVVNNIDRESVFTRAVVISYSAVPLLVTAVTSVEFTTATVEQRTIARSEDVVGVEVFTVAVVLEVVCGAVIVDMVPDLGGEPNLTTAIVIGSAVSLLVTDVSVEFTTAGVKDSTVG